VPAVTVASCYRFLRVRPRQLRETEVENLDLAVVGDKQILGFEIAMHDPFVVRRGETARRLHRDVNGLAQR
jgi:hypothetical protein